MNKKIKILHIIPKFDPAGAERLLVNLLEAFDHEWFEVAAVSLYPESGTIFWKTLHVARLKGLEKHDCRTLAEISDSCIKQGFKMRFFLTVFSLQPIDLSSYLVTTSTQNGPEL